MPGEAEDSVAIGSRHDTAGLNAIEVHRAIEILQGFPPTSKMVVIETSGKARDLVGITDANGVVHLLSMRRITDEVVSTDDPPDHDPVNHPSHYTGHPSGVECITITRHMTFNLGNVVKYLWRAGRKQEAPTIQDLEKAAWYLNDEIERRKKEEADGRSEDPGVPGS